MLTPGHEDRYGGAKYLQDTYHPRLLMGKPDGDMIGRLYDSRPGFGPPPACDIDITDGYKLTLGDTTITFYLTPGHTPGTESRTTTTLSEWAEVAFRRDARADRKYSAKRRSKRSRP